MRPARLLCLAALCFISASAQIPRDEYHGRRLAARKALGDAVLVLFGNTERDLDELRTGFFQEPNFAYLTGWPEPGALLLLTPVSEALFLPKRNPISERYTGRKTAPEDENVRSVTGFEQVLPMERFESELTRALESYSRVLTPTARRYADRVKSLAPLRDVQDATPMLARLRAKKSAGEIELIQRSTDISAAAHRAAWKRAGPGVYEYQVAAAFTFTILDRGCDRNAYAPIVGSGPNALVLHYAKNSRRMEAGDLMLVDAGAECSAYATDITRTAPVNGKFTPRQRELYEVVLGAEKAVIEAIKPGLVMGVSRETPNSLYKIAYEYINSHGKDREGNPLGKYLTHGVSHDVGLEVHDAPPFSYSQPIEAGMVITVEPGIYIPEEGIGIRIEDTVLVTESGAKVLSTGVPKEPDQIEKAMAER